MDGFRGVVGGLYFLKVLWSQMLPEWCKTASSVSSAPSFWIRPCDLWMKFSRDRSKSSGKLAIYISLGGFYSEITPEAKHAIVQPIGTWVKKSFFSDQLDKSPDSGLASDNSYSNCIRHSFSLSFPTANSHAATLLRSLKKKECMIAG